MECCKDIHFETQPGPVAKNASSRPPAGLSLNPYTDYFTGITTASKTQLVEHWFRDTEVTGSIPSHRA